LAATARSGSISSSRSLRASFAFGRGAFAAQRRQPGAGSHVPGGPFHAGIEVRDLAAGELGPPVQDAFVAVAGDRDPVQGSHNRGRALVDGVEQRLCDVVLARYPCVDGFAGPAHAPPGVQPELLGLVGAC
jgi:hypothetical protein